MATKMSAPTSTMAINDDDRRSFSTVRWGKITMVHKTTIETHIHHRCLAWYQCHSSALVSYLYNIAFGKHPPMGVRYSSSASDTTRILEVYASRDRERTFHRRPLSGCACGPQYFFSRYPRVIFIWLVLSAYAWRC